MIYEFLFYPFYFILKLLGWSVALMPGRLRLVLGAFWGWILRSAGFRVNIVRQNIKLVFPGDTLERQQFREQLFRDAYVHIGTLFLELLLLFGGLRFFTLKNVELKGRKNWENAHQKNKGVLILSSHVGNWELIASAGVLSGIPGLMVTKHLKPEFIHKAIEKGRESCGVHATYEPKTMKDILSWIKQKKTIGCILDQYAGPPVGIRIPFFGIPVGTMTAFTYLVKKYQLEVCPVVSYRQKNGKWIVEFSEPLQWISESHPEKEIALNTAQYVSVIEKQILKKPAQWLWTHRRFKGDLSPLRPGEWEEGRIKSVTPSV